MKRSAFLTSLLSLLGAPKLLGKGETPSCPSQTKAPADPDAGPQSGYFLAPNPHMPVWDFKDGKWTQRKDVCNDPKTQWILSSLPSGTVFNMNARGFDS